jgi:ABC-2 type transport system permease protein
VTTTSRVDQTTAGGERDARGDRRGGRVRPSSDVVRVVSADKSVGRRLSEIWQSRDLVVNLVRSEIRVKYKNSALGMVWSMLSPAMTLAIYVLVFQVILKNGIPNFVIFLFSGLLLWNLFQTGVLTATGVIVNNAGLVKRVMFPREILALAAIGSASVFFFFQACVMVVFMVVLHSPPAWSLLWLLLAAMVPLLVLASALAIFLAAVNVYLRDVQHLVEVVVAAAWFWACPIVYSYQNSVAAKLQTHGLVWLYFLNPVTPLVMTFQRVLYNNVNAPSTVPPHPIMHLLPSWSWVTYTWMDAAVLGVGLVLFYVAMVVFGRLSGNFAEEL